MSSPPETVRRMPVEPSADPELLQATAEVDRTLIHLAMSRSLRERLRAGAAMARLAARFGHEEASDRR